ncbi:MAG: hypothetical protein QOC54_2579 [Baekduia sp.]|nr:hypothetical protein [Baekduia sp.]
MSAAKSGPVSPAPCSAMTSARGRKAPGGACSSTVRTPSGVFTATWWSPAVSAGHGSVAGFDA